MGIKIKRHILLPAILLIYVAVIAFFSLPNYRKSSNWTEFWLIIGATVGIIVVIAFIYKKRQTLRDKHKK